MDKKVIVAGHICIDFTPEINCKPQKRLTDLLSPGRLVAVGKAHFSPGGAVSNTGIAMKFFGADVSLMGKIGDDAFGALLTAQLKELGAVDGMIVSAGQQTSYSAVIAIPGIDRVFLHNCGANDTFVAEDIDYQKLDGAILFHFGYPPLMRRMYEDGGTELINIFKNAKQRCAITSLDMAGMGDEADASRAPWKEILSQTLPNTDIFAPSIEELLFCLNNTRYRELMEEADGGDITLIIDPNRDCAPLADLILDMGCKIALIKCGAAGMYCKCAQKNAFKSIEAQTQIDFSSFYGAERFEVSYVPDQIISATGAGDTAIAAFLTALINGKPLEACMRLAAATGACCVAAPDSLSGLKTFEELEKKIAAGWKKNA